TAWIDSSVSKLASWLGTLQQGSCQCAELAPVPRLSKISRVIRSPSRMTGIISPEAIDALLPQTQCRQCGYAGCRPYAEAIAAGRAAINQCPPGGDETIGELAQLLGVPPEPLDAAFGVAKP